MAVKNPVFLVIALFFFALSAYFLFTSPDDELLASSSTSSKPPHPCPYADVLGLDENSPNPHGEGGSLPPIFDAKKFDAAHHDETKGQNDANTNSAGVNHDDADEHRGRRSDYDMHPHVPHQEHKVEL